MKRTLMAMGAVFLAALFIVQVVLGGTAHEEIQTDDEPLSSVTEQLRRPERLDLPTLDADDLPAGDIPPALRAAQEGAVQVIVQLEQAPTAEIYESALQLGALQESEAVNAAQAQLQRIESAQQVVLSQLDAMDATVLYRLQRVYNGIAIQVDASQLGAIAALPGVKSVEPVPIHEPTHASSVGLISAPELWDSLGPDVTGDGISIGIIDTGIDYLHADFGGEGGDDPNLYLINDTTIIGDIGAYPNAKVVGGWDFAGDNYDASGDSGSPIPNPDPDPMDCHGHGTHVAGTAAGYGVNSDGSTYTGPYTEDLDLGNFRIAPGVAPEAELYALRVFGCGGSTALTAAALEWATDPNGDGDFSDHLDVVNMSLGASFGSIEDASVIATNNAAAAGVLVAVSAGNSADVFFVTGSPSVAQRAVSVAAIADSSAVLDAFRVNNTSIAGFHPAWKGVAFDWTGFTTLTAPLSYPEDQSSGCEPFTPANAAEISGTIALLVWTEGECGSSTRGNNLEDAGAVGMLLADDSELFDLNIFGSDEMPSYSIPNEIGAALIDAHQNEGPVSITFDASLDNSFLYQEPAVVDSTASFTSRGPRRDALVKPDVAAPGVSIFSAAALTGDNGASFGGTSMAAPHVAGSLALLRQLNPGWSVEELKALLMNTAIHNVRIDPDLTSPTVGPSRAGAGRIDLAVAANADVVVYSPGVPGGVSVNFGEVEVTDATTMVRTARVVNKMAETVEYDVFYTALNDQVGVDITVSPASVTLPPFGVAEITVEMNATAADMRHLPDPSIDPIVFGLWRHWIAEEGGLVHLMPPEVVFTADLEGENEAPPVTTDATGMAVFTYTHATGELDYWLDVDDITPTAAHIHLGLPNTNGPVVWWLYDADGVNAPDGPFPVNGTIQISDDFTGTTELMYLLGERFYVNVHTTDHPAGEIRGQMELTDQRPPLRLPVYVTARPASEMSAVQSTINVTATEAISLTGDGIFTGLDFPFDIISLVSAYELQATDPDEPVTTGKADAADMAFIGAMSDIRGTATVTNPNGIITDTLINFGIGSYAEWDSPATIFFDVYIDVDEDGSSDYVLFNWDLGAYGYSDDTFFTWLLDLTAGTYAPQWYLNGVSASLATYPFNNNVMGLPVWAEDLGLNPDNTDFNYYVVSFSRDLSGVADVSPLMTYDAANPGLDFSGGFTGAPAWADLDGEAIPVVGDRDNYVANRSLGALLLHHHNVFGTRIEVLPPENPIQPEADLSLTKSVETDTVTVGDLFTYTLTVENVGDFAAGVTLTDTLPTEVTFVSATASDMSPCNEEANVVICDLGTLERGDTVTVNIAVVADSAGMATNTAEVGTTTADIFTGNNTASVVVTIERQVFMLYMPAVFKGTASPSQ
ncbi:MAG: S8 family serine peptidase [Candidatus Promineifilaceae bacterium]|nr:S8 family serine peptidase [Candidatus Promineifilaceae bacterium]